MQATEKSTKELWTAVGGLSNPSKMPSYGYGLSAFDCKVGELLRKVKGTTCSGCYATRGNYTFPAPKKAHAARMEAISRPDWVENMSELIRRKCEKYFRWHDSGDVQSLQHLENIAQIAKNVPNVTFWLPTREVQIVKEYLSKHGKFPRNLTVRISAAMIGAAAPRIEGTVGSSVSNPDAYQCPAPTQGNECRDCRACWKMSVKEVSYKKH